jgi:predicted amidohydrolase
LLAVAAAEQKDEPLQVTVQFVQAVGGVDRLAAGLAAQLGLWTVFGSLHPLTPPRRPHNSLYVISPSGVVVTRYDKRFLSNTEITWMYTPGREPVVFDAEGLRFGCALCIEVTFPRSSLSTNGWMPIASLCPLWWTTPSAQTST